MRNFKYRIIRTGFFRKSTTIRISPKGEIIVRAPSWVSNRDIENFIKSKSNWITRHLKPLLENPPRKGNQYTHGEMHLFFGKEYPLNVEHIPYISRCRLKFEGEVFRAVVPNSHSQVQSRKELNELMLKLYLDHGKKIINEKVFHYTKILGVEYNRITLKRVSSIWGSCSRQNNLNFNRKLVMAPHPVVDYVVIHEVCHLVHRHHQKEFWSLVKRLCPDYKVHISWLKKNHHLLAI